MWIQTSWETIEVETNKKQCLLSDTDLEKTCFLMKSQNFLRIILNFSQFHKHIFRNSRLQMFFKIVALQRFAIFSIKKKLPLEGALNPLMPSEVAV